MIITLSDAAALKKEIAEKFSAPVHFHDSCSGPSFFLEEPNAEIVKYITDYFAKKNLRVIFAEDGMLFKIEKNV